MAPQWKSGSLAHSLPLKCRTLNAPNYTRFCIIHVYTTVDCTSDCDAIDVSFLNAVHHHENIWYFGCGYIFTFPSVNHAKLNQLNMLQINMIITQFGNDKNLLESAPLTLTLTLTTGASLPESVSNPILKVDKVFMVDFQQVATVEIEITFNKHLLESFLFGLLLISSVTHKWRLTGDFPNQQSRLTCKIIYIILINTSGMHKDKWIHSHVHMYFAYDLSRRCLTWSCWHTKSICIPHRLLFLSVELEQGVGEESLTDIVWNERIHNVLRYASLKWSLSWKVLPCGGS